MTDTTVYPDRFVRDAEATRITGLGRTAREQLTKEGRFPQKRQISKRATGYRLRELLDWMDQRPVAHDTPHKVKPPRADKRGSAAATTE